MERTIKTKFKVPLNDLSLKAEECLFIDDSKQNIEFAQTLGFDTINYPKGIERLFTQAL